MLRDPSLIPLSHQHQHGLALCVMIERGLQEDRSPENTARLARRVADTFELELRNHFDVEERILFPAIREKLGPTPQVEELVADHRRLEGLVERVAKAEGENRARALLELAGVLSRHIRLEERELFEDIQKRLPCEKLQELGRAIDAGVVRVCL
ncbi:MAG: hemerythrin domain-containing protein [Acidobacteria bacterium]|nr:hemerythrin domain-containing protein [Acidobacteriota bacterium]